MVLRALGPDSLTWERCQISGREQPAAHNERSIGLCLQLSRHHPQPLMAPAVFVRLHQRINLARCFAASLFECRVRLFLPSLCVHAEDKQPQGQRDLADGADGHIIRGQ